jgi:hypothetical protein
MLDVEWKSRQLLEGVQRVLIDELRTAFHD